MLVDAKWYERLGLIAASILLVDGGILTDVIGLVLFVAIFLLQRVRKKRVVAA